MTNHSVFIIKASGQKEPYHEHKLKKSLERSNASQESIKKILSHIRKILKNGMTTHDIYQEAFKLLNENPPIAKRYSLKRRIMNLGPDGHKFEKFVGKLFSALGYQTETNLIVQGKCVTHEVDVRAIMPNETLYIECKFHNLPGTKSDIKTSLYVNARVDDIKDQVETTNILSSKKVRAGLVTNTSLTSDAIKYGICRNIHLLAWNYPPNAGLETLITRYQLDTFL